MILDKIEEQLSKVEKLCGYLLKMLIRTLGEITDQKIIVIVSGLFDPFKATGCHIKDSLLALTLGFFSEKLSTVSDKHQDESSSSGWINNFTSIFKYHNLET